MNCRARRQFRTHRRLDGLHTRKFIRSSTVPTQGQVGRDLLGVREVGGAILLGASSAKPRTTSRGRAHYESRRLKHNRHPRMTRQRLAEPIISKAANVPVFLSLSTATSHSSPGFMEQHVAGSRNVSSAGGLIGFPRTTLRRQWDVYQSGG